ncbi:MAG: DUF4827 domain-containing protein [Bacteroidaceae bacterium]|nr:DUF4827 domain-containing protein [Bacteroidaceae bacterium]
MKKLLYLFFLLVVAGVPFAACDDTETYAEMKEKERDAINAFVRSQGINAISVEQFYAQDSTTNVAKNEYVRFEDTGIYMQVVSRGEGAPISDGERVELLVRYYEVNIKEMDTLSGNKFDASNPDVMTVENKKSSYSGSFTSGYMCSIYGSSVPSGWLAPMPYLNIGRRLSNLAHVRLIVPHSEGQSTAASYVYPCFYDITFERGR